LPGFLAFTAGFGKDLLPTGFLIVFPAGSVAFLYSFATAALSTLPGLDLLRNKIFG
jgi:hypothetical protein